MDECETGNGGCSQECVNRNATYECCCEKGYQLQADNRTCLGNNKKYFQGQLKNLKGLDIKNNVKECLRNHFE